MKQERSIIAYKHYFADFMKSIGRAEADKISYILDMLKTQERINEKFVKSIVMNYTKLEQNTTGIFIEYSSFSTKAIS